MTNSIIVKAEWDRDAKVWVATTEDVTGFVAEAQSIEALQPKVMAVLADLIELNGIDCDLAEIPVHILASRTDRLGNPQAG
jgi:hypothetical protein